MIFFAVIIALSRRILLRILTIMLASYLCLRNIAVTKAEAMYPQHIMAISLFSISLININMLDIPVRTGSNASVRSSCNLLLIFTEHRFHSILRYYIAIILRLYYPIILIVPILTDNHIFILPLHDYMLCYAYRRQK